MIKKMNFSYRYRIYLTEYAETIMTRNCVVFKNTDMEFINKAKRETIRLAI